MNYEMLDNIADAYIPILVLAFIGGLVYRLIRYWPAVGRPVLDLAYCAVLLIIAYGLMFLDEHMQIWASFGSDYSTHTAVALVFIFALSRQWRSFRIALWASFVAYAALMLYQRYHTLLDIASTALVVAAAAVIVSRLTRYIVYVAGRRPRHTENGQSSSR
jgi:hypothetical protein